MKIEVELQPGVTLDSPAVQKLVKQLEEVQPTPIRRKISEALQNTRRTLDGRHIQVEEVEAVLAVFRGAVAYTEQFLPEGNTDFWEGVREFRRRLMEDLK